MECMKEAMSIYIILMEYDYKSSAFVFLLEALLHLSLLFWHNDSNEHNELKEFIEMVN